MGTQADKIKTKLPDFTKTANTAATIQNDGGALYIYKITSKLKNMWVQVKV